MVWGEGKEIGYNHSTGGAILGGVVREVLPEGVIFEQSLEWREGEANIWGKDVLGRGSRKCKGLETETSSECVSFRVCTAAHG